jgi:hypothetical protein
MILSTCKSFIPRNLYENKQIFPERSSSNGAMYVEAEDKQTIKKIKDLTFVNVSEILGIIYNSKSGKTRLKWRYMKDNIGKLTGNISSNTLVNLFASGALDESFIRKQSTKL